jgi:hypothetical protein
VVGGKKERRDFAACYTNSNLTDSFAMELTSTIQFSEAIGKRKFLIFSHLSVDTRLKLQLPLLGGVRLLTEIRNACERLGKPNFHTSRKREREEKKERGD